MEEIMKKYDELHKKDAMNNYANDSCVPEQSIVANFLFNNLDKMSDKNKKEYLLKCFNQTDIKRELLRFELKNYTPIPKDLNADNFIKSALALLKRYQWKAGGFYLDDDDWNVYFDNENHDDKNYDYICFENSIDKFDAKDTDTILFLKRIRHILGNISTTAEVSYSMHESKNDDLVYVTVCAKVKAGYNKNEPNKAAISL